MVERCCCPACGKMLPCCRSRDKSDALTRATSSILLLTLLLQLLLLLMVPLLLLVAVAGETAVQVGSCCCASEQGREVSAWPGTAARDVLVREDAAQCCWLTLTLVPRILLSPGPLLLLLLLLLRCGQVRKWWYSWRKDVLEPEDTRNTHRQ